MSKSQPNKDILSNLENLVSNGKRSEVISLVSGALLGDKKRSELKPVQIQQLDNLSGYIYNQLTGVVLAKMSSRPQIDQLSGVLKPETKEQLTDMIGMTAGAAKTNRFKGLIGNLAQKNLTHVNQAEGKKQAAARDKDVDARNKDKIVDRDASTLTAERAERNSNVSKVKESVRQEEMRRTKDEPESRNAEFTRMNNSKHIGSMIKGSANLTPIIARVKRSADQEQARRTNGSAESKNAEFTRMGNSKDVASMIKDHKPIADFLGTVSKEFSRRLDKDAGAQAAFKANPKLKGELEKALEGSLKKNFSKSDSFDPKKLNADSARKLADVLVTGLSACTFVADERRPEVKSNIKESHVEKVQYGRVSNARGQNALEAIKNFINAVVESFASVTTKNPNIQPLRDFFHDTKFIKLTMTHDKVGKFAESLGDLMKSEGMKNVGDQIAKLKKEAVKPVEAKKDKENQAPAGKHTAAVKPAPEQPVLGVAAQTQGAAKGA